jgi:SAM-dependent methyltransferase
VADIGAGTGRYCRILAALEAGEILAVEPSSAFEILKKNTSLCRGIQYLQTTADHIPPHAFDMVFCIGVLQFIPNPILAMQSMGRALHPEGKLFLWVYGEENNRLYLSLVRPMRKITSCLSHESLDILSSLMVFPADMYALLCQYLRLPMAEYMRRYFSKLNFYSRKLVVYDQLNPKYAKYYRKAELENLLEQSGFYDIQLYHHLGYSWSVSARYHGC